GVSGAAGQKDRMFRARIVTSHAAESDGGAPEGTCARSGSRSANGLRVARLALLSEMERLHKIGEAVAQRPNCDKDEQDGGSGSEDPTPGPEAQHDQDDADEQSQEPEIIHASGSKGLNRPEDAH